MNTNFHFSESIILDTILLEGDRLSSYIKHATEEQRINAYVEAIAIIDAHGNLVFSNKTSLESDSEVVANFIIGAINTDMFYPLTVHNGYVIRYSMFTKDGEAYSFLAYQHVEEFIRTFQKRELLEILIMKLSTLMKEKIENDFLLNNLYDLITIIDNKGSIVRTNSKILEQFGLSEDEIVGKNTADLVAKGVITNSVSQQVLTEKTTVTMTQDTQTGKCLTVTGYPVFNPEGEIFRIINISRDITEMTGLEKKLEESDIIMHEYEKQLRRLREKVSNPTLLVTSSIKMREALNTIRNITNIDSTVLIEGETGVGKGVLAKTIHHTSTRSSKPFIKINCASIPSSLFESELFGYERGSFTGALSTGKIGLVAESNGGTLFLDEIGELPLPMQAKVLDLIQNKSFYPVGGTKEKKVDIRIIAATNKDLKEKVQSGEFREDLYYRLAVIPIFVPPLRERKDEIQILVDDLLSVYNHKFNKTKHFSRDVIRAFESYYWPGNIRELENLIERLVATTPENLITKDALPEEILSHNSSHDNPILIEVNQIIPLDEAIVLLEKAIFTEAQMQNLNHTQLADRLNIHRTTVIRKAQKYFK